MGTPRPTFIRQPRLRRDGEISQWQLREPMLFPPEALSWSNEKLRVRAFPGEYLCRSRKVQAGCQGGLGEWAPKQNCALPGPKPRQTLQWQVLCQCLTRLIGVVNQWLTTRSSDNRIAQHRSNVNPAVIKSKAEFVLFFKNL